MAVVIAWWSTMLAMMVVVGIIVLVVVRIIVLAWMRDGMSTLTPRDGIGSCMHIQIATSDVHRENLGCCNSTH